MKMIFLLVLFLVTVACVTADAESATQERSLVSIIVPGSSVDDKHHLKITPASGSNVIISNNKDKNTDPTAFSVNATKQGVLFKIESESGISVPEGQGIFITIWAKPVEPDITGILSFGAESKKPDGKARYIPLLSPPMIQGKWARLAGWYYAEKEEHLSFYINAPVKGNYQFSDIKVWYTPQTLPADNRPVVRVERNAIKAGDKTIVFSGVNLYAYSDSEGDNTLHPMVSADGEDYKTIASYGFNVVRLNLWHKVLQAPGGWAWLDLHRLWAKQNGLRLILDLHAPPGAYQGPEYRGKFYKTPEFKSQTIAFWVDAARRLAGDPAIAAFDIINEPCPKKDSEWWDFVNEVVPAIRKAGWNQPIIVEKSFAKDSAFRKLPDESIIYDCHFYEPWNFCSGESGEYGKEGGISYEPQAILNKEWVQRTLKEELVDFSLKHHVPVNIGEYGIKQSVLERGGDQWLHDFSEMANQYSVGRQYWCWHYFDWGLSDAGWHRYLLYDRKNRIIEIIQGKMVDWDSPSPSRGRASLPTERTDRVLGESAASE